MKAVRYLCFVALFAVVMAAGASARAAIFVTIPGVPGDAKSSQGGDWFVADSLSFGVVRETGMGPVAPGTMTLTLPVSSVSLATFDLATQAKEIGQVVVQVPAKPAAEDQGEAAFFNLESCWIESWTIESEEDEAVVKVVIGYTTIDRE